MIVLQYKSNCLQLCSAIWKFCFALSRYTAEKSPVPPLFVDLTNLILLTILLPRCCPSDNSRQRALSMLILSKLVIRYEIPSEQSGVFEVAVRRRSAISGCCHRRCSQEYIGQLFRCSGHRVTATLFEMYCRNTGKIGQQTGPAALPHCSHITATKTILMNISHRFFLSEVLHLAIDLACGYTLFCRIAELGFDDVAPDTQVVQCQLHTAALEFRLPNAAILKHASACLPNLGPEGFLLIPMPTVGLCQAISVTALSDADRSWCHHHLWTLCSRILQSRVSFLGNSKPESYRLLKADMLYTVGEGIQAGVTTTGRPVSYWNLLPDDQESPSTLHYGSASR